MISCKSDFPYTLHIHFVILLFIITKRSVNSDIRFIISWKTLTFTHEELTLFVFALTSVFSFVSPQVLGWSMMVRGTHAVRQKGTLCLPLWLETMGSSSGPPVVDSTSAVSLGRRQSGMNVHKHRWCFASQLLFLSFWNTGGLLHSPEQPRHPVWWMSQSRLVSTSILSNFLDNCMMQTPNASGSLAPRQDSAVSILSRWGIHIKHF